MPLDFLKITKISFVIENTKYSKNFDRKQTENAKGLTEGKKYPKRPQKFLEKL